MQGQILPLNGIFDANYNLQGLHNDSGGDIPMNVGALIAGSPQTVNNAANQTLTSAQMVGGLIRRLGPTAAYGDTTDSAANLVNAIAGATVGASFRLRIRNTVAFANTLAAGAGVTFDADGTTGATSVVAASSFRDYAGVVTSIAPGAQTVTLYSAGSGTL